MKLISLIIPIYNQELYILRCLNSIFESLDFDSKSLIETICINDGSTDKSLQLISNYHEDIKIINRTNHGLGASRNYGIDISEGLYVMFIDSDDSINSCNLSTLIKILKNRNEDCIDFNTLVISKNSNLRYYYEVQKEKYTSYLDDYILGKSKILITAWSRLWKREVLIKNNIRFQENVKFEDVIFAFKFYECSSSFYEIPLDIYYYYNNPLSITKKKNFDFPLLKDLVDVRVTNLYNWIKSSRSNKNVSLLLRKELINCLKKMIKLLFKGIKFNSIGKLELSYFKKGFFKIFCGTIISIISRGYE